MSTPTIAATLGPQSTVPTTVVDPEEFPWAMWMEGLHVKLLQVSEETATYTLLVRFAAGVQLPIHRHMGAVHAYTLQGRWRYLEYDWEATAGMVVYEPPGSTHTLRAEGIDGGETVVLFTMQGGLVVFGPEGEYWAYEDAQTSKERYLMALEHQGETLPEGLL
jgi:2,4'-dihydroxyacetophenone dioxygenase